MTFDRDRYELYLAIARAERGLNLAVVKFDPKKHPRDYMGKFREVLGSLKPGDKVEVMTTRNDDGPDKLEVTYGRDVDTGEAIYEVNNGASMSPTFKTAGRAARNAMRQSGRAGGSGNLPDTLDGGGKSAGFKNEPFLADKLKSQPKGIDGKKNDAWRREVSWQNTQDRKAAREWAKGASDEDLAGALSHAEESMARYANPENPQEEGEHSRLEDVVVALRTERTRRNETAPKPVKRGRSKRGGVDARDEMVRFVMGDKRSPQFQERLDGLLRDTKKKR